MALNKLKKLFADEEENLVGTEDEYYSISEDDALK